MLVDAHCHIEEIKNYSPKGVLPVTCGYSHTSNLRNIEIAERLGIPFVLGIAPQTAIKQDIKDLDKWIDTIRGTKPNAIGEIGLDFHWAKGEEDVKKEWIVFKRMVDLAEEMKLPVVIHSRKAEKECLEYLLERKFSDGIMFHFYSGNEETAKKAVDIGAIISITPLHSKERRKVINAVPLENIVVETDAPYVVRLPEDVIQSVQYVAEVKCLEIDEVKTKTAKNAARFFKFNVK
jgi:TatD DNase family protein